MELELTVNGVAGVVQLWPTTAPTTVSALLASLPLDAEFNQCRWSGDACFTPLAAGPITVIDRLEAPAVTIYPGTLAIRLAEPASPHAELLIGYGSAEHRWPDGPKAITPVGEIRSSRVELFNEMRTIARSGPGRVTLGASKGQD